MWERFAQSSFGPLRRPAASTPVGYDCSRSLSVKGLFHIGQVSMSIGQVPISRGRVVGACAGELSFSLMAPSGSTNLPCTAGGIG